MITSLSPARTILGICVLVLAFTALASAKEPTGGNVARIKVEGHGGAHRIEIERTDDGSFAYVVLADDGSRRSLSPDEFSEWLLEPQTSGNWLERLFNISSPIGFAWVALGLVGQALFTGRMLLQWITSERLGRSTIPTAFWWLSVAGALMLVAYFAWRRDVVGVLGQSTGCFIYLRNLRLIYLVREKVEAA